MYKTLGEHFIDHTNNFTLELDRGHLNTLYIITPVIDNLKTIEIDYIDGIEETSLHEVPMYFYDWQPFNNKMIFTVPLGSVYLGDGRKIRIRFKQFTSMNITLGSKTEVLDSPYFETYHFTTKVTDFKNILAAYVYRENNSNYTVEIDSKTQTNQLTTLELSDFTLAERKTMYNTPIYKSFTGIPENVTIKITKIEETPPPNVE